MPPHPNNTRPHQPPHDLQPHGGSLHDPNPNTLATTSSEHSGEPLQRRVIGYDVNAARVEELRQGHDRTRELSAEELQQAIAAGLELSTNPADLAAADVFIVTVPTPIDSAKRSDLTPWYRANPTRRRW